MPKISNAVNTNASMMAPGCVMSAHASLEIAKDTLRPDQQHEQEETEGDRIAIAIR